MPLVFRTRKFLVALIIAAALIATSNGWRRRRRRTCDTTPCQWRWGSCSRSCGGGTQSPQITRNKGACGACNLPAARRCNIQCCPVNCAMASWVSWSNCSTPCGGQGVSTRTRAVQTSPSCNGIACPESKQTKECNRICYNGGIIRGQMCSCMDGWKGKCCERDVCVNGFAYNKRCVTFASPTWNVKFSMARRSCNKINSDLAEITSDEMYNKVAQYVRMRLPKMTTWGSVNVWLGLTFQPKNNPGHVITLSNNTKISLSYWFPRYPIVGSYYRKYTQMRMRVTKDASSNYQGLRNCPPTYTAIPLCAYEI